MKTMEHLTSGQINNRMVKKFYRCIVEEKGCLGNAAGAADEKYGLNWAASTTETDSWHEAVAQIRSIFSDDFTY